MGKIKFKKIMKSDIVLKPLVSTIIALLLINVLKADITSDTLLSAFCGSSDIEICDFYNRVRANRSQKSFDEDIIIVNVDNLFERSEIADLIKVIASANPAAIGVDLLFEDDKDPLSDSQLLYTLEAVPNLVVAQRYNEYDYVPQRDFISEKLPNIKRGMANLTSTVYKGIIRETTFFFGENQEYPSLEVALMSIIDNDVENKLKIRSTEELIRFNPKEFYVAEPVEIYNLSSLVKDKIVLIGTINEEGDLHKTALSDDTAGVLIHANIMSMILHKDFTNTHSWIYNIILGLLSCILLGWMYVYLNATQNIAMRFFPIVWIAVLSFLGCWAFDKFGIYLDAPNTLLLAFISLLVLDIWTAFERPVKRILIRLSKHENNINPSNS